MRTQLTKKIPPYYNDTLFQPVRSRLDFALVVVNAIELLIIDYGRVKSDHEMKLVVSKTSRLFFYGSGNKFFSIAFPFTTRSHDDQIFIYDKEGLVEIDILTVSNLKSILYDKDFIKYESFYDYAPDEEIHENSIRLLEHIFATEPCYLRYDFDPKNVNGKLHPLHHLDINYSNYGTYKVGLKNPISKNSIEDILDTQSNCWDLVQ